MKQKFADRPGWKRILSKRYVQEYVQDDIFEGHMSVLFLDKVREPLRVNYGCGDICIVDDRHAWLMFFPKDSHYSLTVMLDHDNRVLQWYFDIVNRIGLTEAGIPFIEDLYLDLVVLPGGELYVLDEDELSEALSDGSIDRNQYELAQDELRKQQDRIERGECGLITHAERYVEWVMRKRI